MKRMLFLASLFAGLLGMVSNHSLATPTSGITGFSGKVVEEGGNVGINDARVTAFYSASDSTPAGVTFTDQYGVYILDVGRAGSYFIYAEKDGYKGEWYKDNQPQSVSVQDRQVIPNINFALAKESTGYRAGVAGEVVDENTGQAIVGAEIAIFEYPQSGRPIAETHTNSTGNYEVEFDIPVTPRDVFVACGKTGYQGEWWDNKLSAQEADPVTVEDGQITREINFILSPDGVDSGIAGSVYEESSGGRSIEDAKVSAYSSTSDTTPAASAFTITDGSYKLVLPPGTYYVYAEKDGYKGEWWDDNQAKSVKVNANQVTPDINFALAKDSPQEGAISGMVMDENSNTPLIADYVRLYYGDTNTKIKMINTDQRGFYRFPHLKPGTYYVHVFAYQFKPEWWDDKELDANADSIVVTDKEVGGINFYLTPNDTTKRGAIAGTVKDAVTQDPIKGAYVSLVNVSDRLGAYTDAQGNYLIKGVPVGTYRAIAKAPGYYPEDSNQFEVKANETTKDIDFLLTPDTSADYGSISGRVDGSGVGSLSDAFVAVFPVNADQPVVTVKTDKRGEYKVEKLLPGKYHVRARARGFQEQWFHMVEIRDNATEVEVKAGQNTSNIYFYMDPEQGLNGGISGMVLDTLDQGIPGARVWAQGGWNRYEVDADNTGAYLMKDVMFGLYKVGACAKGYKPGTHSEPVPVVPDSVTSDIDIVLESMPPQDGVISGVVTDDSTQAGIEKAMVVVLRRGNPFFGYAFTDANGAYAVENVPKDWGGPFYVIAFALEYIPEFYDNARSWRKATPVFPDADSIDFQLGHGRKGMMGISGRITAGSKSGVSEAMIYAMDGDQVVGSAFSLDDGTYILGQLPPGTYTLEISAIDYEDVSYGPISVVEDNESGVNIDLSTGTSEDPVNPKKEALWLSVAPNVVNGSATIFYEVPIATHTELSVYDISGRNVVTLVKGEARTGTHQAILNTKDLAQGIYFIKLIAGESQTVRKLVVLR